MSPSIGTPLPKKILNSVSARNKEIGKLKSSSLKMTDGVPSIMTVFPSMQAARILFAIRTMAASLSVLVKDFGKSFQAWRWSSMGNLGMGIGWQPDNGQSVMKGNNAWSFRRSANIMSPILNLDTLGYAKLSNSSSSSSKRNTD